MGTCTPRYKEGEACDLYESCAPGLECHDVCVPGDVGSPCTNLQDCDQSNYCDVQAGVCKADLPLGSPCTDLLQCGGDATCVGLSIVDAAPGRCERISAVGDPCDDFCYGNLTCGASRTCQALPTLGASCSALLPCSGVDATCKNGKCVLRDSAGTKCANSQTCFAGLFCTSELGSSIRSAPPRAPPASPVESRAIVHRTCAPEATRRPAFVSPGATRVPTRADDLEDLERSLRRAGHDGPSVRDDNRTLDENRVLGERAHQGGSVERGCVEAELTIRSLALAH